MLNKGIYSNALARKLFFDSRAFYLKMNPVFKPYVNNDLADQP